MKLEIYDRNKTPEKRPVRLRLQYCTTGVEVVAVDVCGETHATGHILRFNNDGSIYLHLAVHKGFGFDLDGSGRINLQ